jgi:hypothetical protein
MNEYEINLNLECGAKLRILLFSNREHRWIFEHRFMQKEKQERLEKPTLVNDTTLVVDYEKGIAKNVI